jgi:uncharacterized protein
MRGAFVPRQSIRLGIFAGLLALFGVFTMPPVASALEVPPKPIDSPVVDQTNTLSSEQKAAIAAKIAEERTATGNEIAVLMIPTLADDALENYSLNVARGWGIGSKERNAGVLLLIVKDDRKLRIEVGYGLEGALTDIRSNQIIRDRIRPAFQKNDYFGGIQSGVEGIILAVHEEVDPNLSKATATTAGPAHFPWEIVIFLAFFGFSWLASILGRTKSWWAGGVIGGILGVIAGFIFGFLFIGVISIFILTLLGLLFDKVVSANYRSHASHGDAPSWWAGGPFLGGGGSHGGGFGGFGGGGFGGGGASGDW